MEGSFKEIGCDIADYDKKFDEIFKDRLVPEGIFIVVDLFFTPIEPITEGKITIKYDFKDNFTDENEEGVS